MTEPTFVKSSHCSNGACVEVAFVKSSYSGTTNCVEVAFTKSSFCASGACVEIGQDDDDVLMRDSKDLSIELRFDDKQWSELVAGIKAGQFDA